jgi:hypothetical protein
MEARGDGVDDGLYQPLWRPSDGLLYAECVGTKNGGLVNGVRGRYEKESLPHAGVPVSRDIFRLFYHYAEPGSP